MKMILVLKNNKLTSFLIGLLIFSFGLNIHYYVEINNLKYWDLVRNKAVPHVELGNVIIFYGVPTLTGAIIEKTNDGDIGYGEITGFVAFKDLNDQPKGTYQYYTIKSTDRYDEKGNQIFTLTETFKMNMLSPRSLDPEDIYVVQDSLNSVVFESKGGATIAFDKRTKRIELDRGEAYLITNEMRFSDFIKELYE